MIDSVRIVGVVESTFLSLSLSLFSYFCMASIAKAWRRGFMVGLRLVGWIFRQVTATCYSGKRVCIDTTGLGIDGTGPVFV